MITGEKSYKKDVTIFFVVLLLLLAILGNLDDIRERLALWPLLDAAERASGVGLIYNETPKRGKDADGRNTIDIWLLPNNRLNLRTTPDKFPLNDEETEIAVWQQIKGMNDYLFAHPNYSLNKQKYIIYMAIGRYGEIFVISNKEYFAKGDDFTPQTFSALECTSVDIIDIDEYGSKYLQEMRSIYYSTLYNDQGKGLFLETVGDLTVLENLERIGPASNFSEQELAWFAENLPECEVVG